MKVIKKDPGRPAELVEIENTLKALQEAVGGYLEAITLVPDKTAIICNEEGRLKGLPKCCQVFGHVFVGTVLLVGVDGEEFTDVSDPGSLMRFMDLCEYRE